MAKEPGCYHFVMVARTSTLQPQPPTRAPSSVVTPESVVSTARELIRTSSGFWAEGPAWRSPNPAIAGNTEPGKTLLGARNTAKCNLFVFDVLFAAGAKIPTTKGSYPLAFVFAKAAREGSAFEPVATAQLHDPREKQVVIVNPGSTPGAWQAAVKERRADFRASVERNWASAEPEHRTRREQLERAFRAAKPGDIIIEKHRFKDGAGDSHMYLVLKNTYDQTGTIECAQSDEEGAVIVQVSPKFMTFQESVHVVRPKL